MTLPLMMETFKFWNSLNRSFTQITQHLPPTMMLQSYKLKKAYSSQMPLVQFVCLMIQVKTFTDMIMIM